MSSTTTTTTTVSSGTPVFLEAACKAPKLSIEDAINAASVFPNEEVNESFFVENFNISTEGIPSLCHPLKTDFIHRIISNVLSWDSGRSLFTEMVKNLKKENIFLCFCDGTNKGLGGAYGLNLKEHFVVDGKRILMLDFTEKEYLSHARYCAVMEASSKKISIKHFFLEQQTGKSVEGCTVGHEFYHVCSFLRQMGKIDKVDKNRIFDDANEKHVNAKTIPHPLLKNICEKLFQNGEDMRNLCGLALDEAGEVVQSMGEFDFWREAMPDCAIIPLYIEDIDTFTTTCCCGKKLSSDCEVALRGLFRLKYPEFFVTSSEAFDDGNYPCNIV